MKKITFTIFLLFLCIQYGCTNSNSQIKKDYTGKYVLYEHVKTVEIWQNQDSTYRASFENYTTLVKIDGNQIVLLWEHRIIDDPDSVMLKIRLDGLLISQALNTIWMSNMGEKIENPELWSALQAYSKDSYQIAEIGFKKYLQSNPNHLYIHATLVDCLIQEGKVKEARNELTKIENNPDAKSNSLNQWLVPRVKYCLEGKEKSIKGENAWDDYMEAKNLFKYPPNVPSNIYSDEAQISMHNHSIGPKEKESLQIFISSNLESIQKFNSLPEYKECIQTDMRNIPAAQAFARSVVYYGLLQAEEENIEKAVDANRKVIRFGQQMTQGNLICQLIAIAVRSIGEWGFSRLLRGEYITRTEDAELILNTLKELRKKDTISTIESLYRFEPPHSETISVAAPTRAHVTETKLILLETEAAIKFYNLRTQDYPMDIKELVPDYLSEIPVDTFYKNPIKLQTIGWNLVPYSYGPDTTDNNGLIQYDPTNGTISQGDLFYSNIN